jgi:membrane-bound lytic murein transglycosylase D
MHALSSEFTGMRPFILLIVSVFTAFQSMAIEKDSTRALLTDDPVLAMLDSLDAALHFEASKFTTDRSVLNVLKLHQDSIPSFPDKHYRDKLAKLDANTPFRLVYNEPVRKYIDAYTGRHRERVAYILGLAELYFPLFEETLDRYDLPLELKYLAIVESALNPLAKSKSGAMGLWQFMYRTGKIYDLNTTSYVDDRSDPFKATDAACQYFQYLYAMFGNWELVLAAYNGGPGTLNKAIRRSGGKRDYWELRPYLPVETQGYVPAFIAVNYVMKHASMHNIYPVKPDFFSYDLDTVVVHKRTDLALVARELGIPYEQMEFLNPTFRTSIVPESDNGYAINLPKKKVGLFLANAERFYEASQTGGPETAATNAPAAAQPVAAAKQQDVDRRTHKVRRGETLSSIASRYRCSVNDICVWNGMKGHVIKEGQSIVLYANPAAAAATARGVQQDGGGTNYHVVQKGDTLWDIAKRNGLSVQELKELNGLGNQSELKIGQKLKVG